MAKQHLQHIARELASKYTEVENLMREAGLALQNIPFDPEEQKEFAIKKANVDNELSFLSVALSAAAKGEIYKEIKKLKEEESSYCEPLQHVVDDLARPDITPEVKIFTENLIATYNNEIRKIQKTTATLLLISSYASFPRNKKKQRKKLCSFIEGTENMSLAERLKLFYQSYSPFVLLETEISNFRVYIDSIKNEQLETPSEVDDLLE